MVKCLNIGKNIGKPIYRSISTFNMFLIFTANQKALRSGFNYSISMKRKLINFHDQHMDHYIFKGSVLILIIVE